MENKDHAQSLSEFDKYCKTLLSEDAPDTLKDTDAVKWWQV
jgi:hypothetical protein